MWLRSLACGCLLAAIAFPLSAFGLRAQAQVQQLAVPGPEGLIGLIRNTVIGLNQANLAGNYTVFRDTGSPAFQSTYTDAQLAQTFTALREAKMDLTPILVVIPELTKPPAIDAQGVLRLTGIFPTRPVQIHFELMFQLSEGKWRHAGVAVSASGASVAPSPQQPAAEVPAVTSPPKKPAMPGVPPTKK